MAIQRAKLLLACDDPSTSASLQDSLAQIAPEGDVVVCTRASYVLVRVEAETPSALILCEALGSEPWSAVAAQVHERCPRLFGVLALNPNPTGPQQLTSTVPNWLDMVSLPADRSELRSAVMLAIAQSAGRKGLEYTDQSVLEMLELAAIDGLTTVLRARLAGGTGTLTFEMGRLLHASTGRAFGPQAVRALMGMGRGGFRQVLNTPHTAYPTNVQLTLMELLRLGEEGEASTLEQPVATPPQAPPPSPAPESSRPSIQSRQLKNTQHEAGDLNMNTKKLSLAVENFRDRLGPGLIACDVWGEDGFSLAGHNSQPEASALFSDMTARLIKLLTDANFPSLGRYYMIELADKKLVCIMLYQKHQWGSLIDLEKTNLGMLISVALPKALEDLRTAAEMG